jgi:hypothetical protein
MTDLIICWAVLCPAGNKHNNKRISNNLKCFFFTNFNLYIALTLALVLMKPFLKVTIKPVSTDNWDRCEQDWWLHGNSVITLLTPRANEQKIHYIHRCMYIMFSVLDSVYKALNLFLLDFIDLTVTCIDITKSFVEMSYFLTSWIYYCQENLERNKVGRVCL